MKSGLGLVELGLILFLLIIIGAVFMSIANG